MDIKPLISIAIFVICYMLIVTERVPRVFIALAGTFFLILFGVYTPHEVTLYVDWETIGFLFGIFISVRITEESGFFNFLALLVAKKLHFNPLKLFVFFPLMAALLAGFIDSLSVIAFLVPLTYALSRILKFNPVPFIIAEICLANIGGAATLMGNPPNVIFGSMFDLGLVDFLKHNWIISFMASCSAITVFFLMHRKNLGALNEKIKKEELGKLVPGDAIEDKFLMKMGLTGLLSTMILLLARDFLRDSIQLNIALASLVPPFSILSVKGNHPRLKNILKEIDIETLLFFAGLFVIVGSLEKTGVMSYIAGLLATLADYPFRVASILFWGGALTSGFIDNIPEAIGMAYIIRNITPYLSFSFTLLIWAAILGLDIGGNFTPLGAGANVVGYTFMEKHKMRVGWKIWFKLAFFPTFAALIVAWAGLFLKFVIGFY